MPCSVSKPVLSSESLCSTSVPSFLFFGDTKQKSHLQLQLLQLSALGLLEVRNTWKGLRHDFLWEFPMKGFRLSLFIPSFLRKDKPLDLGRGRFCHFYLSLSSKGYRATEPAAWEASPKETVSVTSHTCRVLAQAGLGFGKWIGWWLVSLL